MEKILTRSAQGEMRKSREKKQHNRVESTINHVPIIIQCLMTSPI